MAAGVRAVVFGAVATGLAALAVRTAMGGYQPVGHGHRVLSAKEQEIVAACADAFFPPDGPIPVSGSEANLVAYMDDYVDRLPVEQRRLVRLLLHFIEHGPWIFGPKPVRFTRLDHAARLEVLDRMRRSPIYFRRIAFLSMRTMLTMGYLADESVAEAMGVVTDPTPFSGATSRPAPPGEEGT